MHNRACYPVLMSKCANNEDEILRQLAKNVEPVTESKSDWNDPGIYGFFLREDSLCIGQHTFVAGNSTPLYLGKTESGQKARDFKQHLSDGGTGYSTLRRSLGALLCEPLKLKPRPRSEKKASRRRFTHFKFGAAGGKATYSVDGEAFVSRVL